MTKLSEIYAAVNSERPHHPYVRFLSSIEGSDCYPEEGMFAQIIGCEIEGHEDDGTPYYKVVLNFAPFETFNKSKEKSDYCDSNQVPCLTAREAGFYKVVDTIYLNENSPLKTVSEDKEILPFEDISDNQMKSIALRLGYAIITIGEDVDLNKLALSCFAKGDVSSKFAVYLRVWANNKIKKIGLVTVD